MFPKSQRDQHEAFTKATTLHVAALQHYRSGSYRAAERLLKKALKELKNSRNHDDQLQLELLFHLGTSYGYLGRYDDAIRTLNVLKPLAKSCKSAWWLDACGWLAAMYWELDDYSAAEQLLKEMITSIDTLYWTDETFERSQVAATFMRSFSNLGEVLVKQAKYEEAEQYFDKALNWLSTKQADYQEVATMLCTYGRMLAELQKTKAAELVFEQALKEARKAGTDSLVAAQCAQNLAQFYESIGEVDVAQPLYQEASEARKMHWASVTGSECMSLALAEKSLGYRFVISSVEHSHLLKKEFLDAVEEGLNSIPKQIAGMLYRAGYRILVVPKMSSCRGSWLNYRAGGYRSSTVMRDVGGCFDSVLKLAIVAQDSEINRIGTLKVVLYAISALVIRHECGHALDDFLQHPSKGNAFEKAFKKDMASANLLQKLHLACFAPKRAGRCGELFADSFAQYCAPQSLRRSFVTTFPNAVAVARTIFDRYAKSAE